MTAAEPAELARFPYRSAWWVDAGAGAFFGVCGLALQAAARAGEPGVGWFAWVCWAFVALAVVNGVMRRVRNTAVVVTEAGVRIPTGFYGRKLVLVRAGDVRTIELQSVYGLAIARIVHTEGVAQLSRLLFPAASDFDRVVAYLGGDPWRAAPTEGAAAVGASIQAGRRGGVLELVRQLAMRIGGFMLVLGGPMHLKDPLAVAIGDPAAIVVMLGTVAIFVYGLLTTDEATPGRRERGLVVGGALAAAAIAVMGVWTIIDLATNKPGADSATRLVFSAFGIAGWAWYVWAAVRFWRRGVRR